MRSRYEEHHEIEYTDAALKSACELSAKYINDRFLPDKAIDLVDEAASRVRMYKSPAAQESKRVMAELRELNPALRRPVYLGQKYVPKGYRLRLPYRNDEDWSVIVASIEDKFYKHYQKENIQCLEADRFSRPAAQGL